MKKRLVIIIALAALLTGGGAALLMSDSLGGGVGKGRPSRGVNDSPLVRSETVRFELTLFQKAIVHRDEVAVKRYLDMGADVELRVNSTYYLNPQFRGIGNNFINIAGYTPLHLATAMNESHIVEILLKHGANPESRIWPFGDTPLIVAARNGNARIVRLLLEHGADPCAEGGGEHCWQEKIRHATALGCAQHRQQSQGESPRGQYKECIEILKAAMEREQPGQGGTNNSNHTPSKTL